MSKTKHKYVNYQKIICPQIITVVKNKTLIGCEKQLINKYVTHLSKNFGF